MSEIHPETTGNCDPNWFPYGDETWQVVHRSTAEYMFKKWFRTYKESQGKAKLGFGPELQEALTRSK